MKKNEVTDENEFMKWFMKNYKPDPKIDGWYIDKVCHGAKATIEGARNQFKIVKQAMIDFPFPQ